MRPDAQAGAVTTRGRASGPRRGGRLVWMLALAALLLAGWDPLRAPDPDVAAGNRAFERGAYDEARAAYQRALARDASPGDEAQIQLNLGAALYRQALARRGDARAPHDAADEHTDALLAAAEAAFRRALAVAPDALRSVAFYDLGNALAQRGQLDEAARAYRDALRADPGNDDARYNLELVDLRRRAAGESARPGRDGQPGRPGGGQRGPRGPGHRDDPGAGQPGQRDGTPRSGDGDAGGAGGGGSGDPGGGAEPPARDQGTGEGGGTPGDSAGGDASAGAASGSESAATGGEGDRRGEREGGGDPAGDPRDSDGADRDDRDRSTDDSAPDYATAPRELDRKLHRLEQRSRELRRDRLRRRLGRDATRDGEPPPDW